MVESPQNLYARNLKQLFGYPLRFPEPKPGLPVSYAENGLHIGDVGYVNDDGMFEVRFNICSPPDHDLHRGKDLGGLVGLTEFKPNEAPPIPSAFPSGRVICHGIQGSHGDDLNHTQRFVSYSASGAILILPSGATRQSLPTEKEEEFRKLAEKHAVNWRQFAGCKSFYLITGFYKASSWYLASFHDVRPLKQVLLERDHVGRYTWDSRCDYRKSVENRDENQAVLISGFKIEVRDWDKCAVVEKLPAGSRGIWSELKLLAISLFRIFAFFWEQIAWRRMLELQGYGTPENMDAGADVSHLPALSKPFHPSDIINRYLLDKNPNLSVAITHDSQGLSMLEKNELPHEDMVDEGRFRAFLEEDYTDHISSDSVVYIRRKTEHTHEESNNLRKSVCSREIFSVSAVPGNTRQLVITRMRAENMVTCLRRMPIGFYVIMEFDGIRRSKCRPALLYSDIVEWDDEITLPTDSTVKVQFSIVASFEFEPVLGNGEILCNLDISVGKLTEGGGMYFLSSSRGRENTSCCPTLLITLEERQLHPLYNFGPSDSILRCEDGSCLEAEVTDKGHRALLHYYRGEGKERLLESVGCFELVLSICPPNHDCHAVALFNCAMASFKKAQVDGSIFDLNVAIGLYRKALELRLDCHPDRPRTLLHLVQALSVRRGKLQYEACVTDEVDIENFVIEIKRICSESSYEHRAANLVVQMLKQYRVWTSKELVELDEWVSEVDLYARMPPEWDFDRPHRLMNLAIALRRRFEITGHLDHLGKSISVMKEALQLMSDGHFNKPWVLASLGDALCARFKQCGDITDLAGSISRIEDAVKLVPDGHFDKPWMLTCLGDALRVRFVQLGDRAELDNSIAIIESAMKLAPCSHFYKPRMLASLSDALRVRFVQRSDVIDLDNSITMIEEASKFATDGHLEKPWILASLGNALHARFVQHSDVPNLESSVSLIGDAIKLIPDGHSDGPWILASLGHALRARFMQHGDIADLERSISMFEDAVKFCPDGRSDKPWMLTSLGNALCMRFLQCGHVADLANSISKIEDAVKLIPSGHFDKPWILASLGNALRARFVQHGNAADLKGSISMFEDVMKLSRDDHPDKPWILTSYGDALRVRFVQYGDVADINNSISMTKDAVRLSPDSHFDKPWLLTSLGSALCVRSVQLGDFASLDNSIAIIEDAMKLAPGSHSYKPRILASLSDALRVRFVQRGDVADLESSISMIKDAGKLSPDGHSDKPWILASLGDALRARFVQHGDVADPERSISMLEDAVKLSSDGHSDKPWMLTSLGDALCARFVRRGDVANLERPISMIKYALTLPPASHFDKPWMLAALGDALRIRFSQCGDITDLDSSISVTENAVKLVPDGHFDKPRIFTCLGDALRVRFVHGGIPADLDSSVSMIEDAVKLAPDTHVEKPWILTRLGLALFVRFFGDKVSDLSTSICMTGSSLHLTPTAQLSWLYGLFRQPTSDLEEAISKHRYVLELLPDVNPHKVGHLTNLASSLFARFWRLRHLGDLEEAILAYQNALELVPDGHPENLHCLNNLALSFSAWSERIGELSDLRKTTLLLHEADAFLAGPRPIGLT